MEFTRCYYKLSEISQSLNNIVITSRINNSIIFYNTNIQQFISYYCTILSDNFLFSHFLFLFNFNRQSTQSSQMKNREILVQVISNEFVTDNNNYSTFAIKKKRTCVCKCHKILILRGSQPWRILRFLLALRASCSE